jgi:peptidoglycan/LPS O-acetylase OafA/YrhL
MARKHFHSFDAFRFFSFFLVFLLHLPKSENTLISFFQKSGGIGVSFFFVLSGFLITYILLYEKQETGIVSLKNFFARRILRIWPLFYLMIGFAFISQWALSHFGIATSSDGYDPDWTFSLLFLENYKMMMEGSFPNGAPLRVMWSLCIEEHFYILWGIIFFIIQPKRIPWLIAISIVVANITRIFYLTNEINTLDVFSNLDLFAFGAIPAYLLIYNNDLLKKINRPSLSIKYSILILCLAFIFIVPNIQSDIIPYVESTLFGLLFSLVILFTLGKKPIHIKDSFLISKLGIYTYGLYLMHTIVILFILQINKILEMEMSWWINSVLALFITIIVSYISYHLIEKRFLKLKRYFRS